MAGYKWIFLCRRPAATADERRIMYQLARMRIHDRGIRGALCALLNAPLAISIPWSASPLPSPLQEHTGEGNRKSRTSIYTHRMRWIIGLIFRIHVSCDTTSASSKPNWLFAFCARTRRLAVIKSYKSFWIIESLVICNNCKINYVLREQAGSKSLTWGGIVARIMRLLPHAPSLYIRGT